MRQNRAFLKPQDVMPLPPIRQPAQAPNLMPAPNPVQLRPNQDQNSETPTTQTKPLSEPRPPSLNTGRPKRNIKMPVRFQD